MHKMCAIKAYLREGAVANVRPAFTSNWRQNLGNHDCLKRKRRKWEKMKVEDSKAVNN